MTARLRAARLPSQTIPCPYLAGLEARFTDYLLVEYDAEALSQLLEHGYRRFGRHLFRPACPGAPGASWCGACLPLRVPTARFQPSRSQRRVLRRGADVELRIGRPVYSEEKYEIYRRHKQRFPRPDAAGEGAGDRGELAGEGAEDEAQRRESFRFSFYDGNPFTQECEYRLEGRLIAFSLLDLTARCASSIYACFDPELAPLSPGTLSALREIESARERGIPYYYLGYAIHGNPSMRYKLEFRPNEVFDGAEWRPFRDADGRYRFDPAAFRAGRWAAELG
ncbi:MAG TPA: arginyltransferase [Candidatus Sumerlaeota bacterium]|nr:arginyltransferase [Candidatus Sumerlaeota bacterium]HOR27172.1 arginyltransferase [Candidatus Sumerlaeota bacterium]